jgi:hypothetical protein
MQSIELQNTTQVNYQPLRYVGMVLVAPPPYPLSGGCVRTLGVGDVMITVDKFTNQQHSSQKPGPLVGLQCDEVRW